jgi:hypothetical protein
VLCVVAVQVPVSMRGFVACLALVPALLSTLRGASLIRDVSVPTGTRVARLRELCLSDYLPSRLRWAMWTSAAFGAAAVIRVALAHQQPWAIASAGLLVLGPAAVEVAGNRLARQPEPAVDAAHLYWQDALRSDLVRSTAAMATSAGFLLCILTPTIAGLYDEADMVAWYGLGAILVAFLIFDEERSQRSPASYMRSRLWPMLGPDQVLRPGDPLPTQRAAA